MTDEVKTERPVIQTVCLGCVFAKTDWIEDKSCTCQQKDGCELGAIRKFRERGERVIEAEDESGNEFYVLDDCLCPFYRPFLWKKGTELDKCIKRVRYEVTIKPEVIVYYGKNGSLDELRMTLDSLKNCALKPHHTYITNHSNDRPSQIIGVLKEYGLKWRIETILENDADLNRALNLTTRKCSGRYVTYFQAGFEVSPDFFTCIDNFLNDELGEFILLTPTNATINGTTSLLTLARMIPMPMIDDVVRLSNVQKSTHLVKSVADIVPSMGKPK
jgi:hypothetical protein